MVAKPKRILLVEDNVTHARLIERFFENKKGYRLTHYPEAKPVIQLLNNGSPESEFDIILLDYSLPDINGLQFIKQLNTSLLETKPPIIMITGQGDENIAVEAMKLGAMDYIVKSQKNWLNTLPIKIAQALVFRELAFEVEELRALSQAVFENSFDSIIVANLSGKILFVNPSLISLCGYENDKEIANNLHIATIFETKEITDQILESTRKKTQIRNLRTKIISQNGTQIPVAVSSGPMKGQDKLLIVLTDLRVEEELSAELKRFKKFSADHMYINVFKVGNYGPEVLVKADSPFSEEVLHKMAIFYSVSLGQGDAEHSGLFGPLPIPERSIDDDGIKYLSLVYSFSIEDPTNKDPRAKGRSFSFFSITMNDNLIEIYSNRKALKKQIDSFMESITNINQLNENFLKSVKEIVLA